jgi:hypothetical protein
LYSAVSNPPVGRTLWGLVGVALILLVVGLLTWRALTTPPTVPSFDLAEFLIREGALRHRRAVEAGIGQPNPELIKRLKEDLESGVSPR